MNSEKTVSMQGSLRRRLLYLLALPMTALLLFSLAIDYRIAFKPAADAYDHALADDAVELSERIRYLDARLQVDLPDAVEAVLRTDDESEAFLSIYGPDKQLLAGEAGLLPVRTDFVRTPVFADGEFRGRKIRKVSYWLETAGGQVVVTVAETTHKRERAGSNILAAMLLPNILLIIATLALVYIGVRRGLAPLTDLSKEIGRRSRDDLSPLPQRAVPGEAQPLVKAMYGLIDDLRSASVAQQAFLANAAHQIKTPLAGLQAQLELHAQELPPEYGQRAHRLLEGTRRLGHLTHQLLALARSGQEANLAQEKHPVDLERLIESSASNWFDQARLGQIDIGFETKPGIVLGSEWMLREMLSNLVDNALRYSPQGGTVTVRCGLEHDGAFLEVEDNGPGIPVAQRSRIFERFYRIDETISEGSGLGLAIVKEVADRHQAGIEFRPASSSTGTLIRVVFPAPTARSGKAGGH